MERPGPGELLLVEHAFLLMVDKKTARWADPPVVSGALLIDLERHGCLEQRNGHLVARPCNPGHPVLERARAAVSESPEAWDAKGWVKQLPKQLRGLDEDLARALVERGLLVERAHKRFGLISMTRLYVEGPDLAQEFHERLLGAFYAGSQPAEEDCLLTALLFPGDMPDMVPKDRVREARAWLMELYTSRTQDTAINRVRPLQTAVLRAVQDAHKRSAPAGAAAGIVSAGT